MRILSGTQLAVCFSIFISGNAIAQIEEIVVTAQKRPENIQNVPISISAFSGGFMESSGIDTLQDLGAYVPNLSLSKSSQTANQRIIIRGVGSVGDSAIEPSVAVFIDGVYYPRSSSVVGAMSDIEIVEVLRGPQGTLYGRNASMGALNISTAGPTEEFEGRLRASYGNYNAVRVAGTVSNSLSDQTSGRLSFNFSDRDGYGKNTFTGAGNDPKFGDWQDYGFRGKLNFTPSDVLDINMTVDYSRVKNESAVIEALSDTVLPAYLGTLSFVLNPLGPLPGGDLPETSNSFDYTVNQDHRDNADDKQWGGILDIDWAVGDHNIRSITGYRDWNNDTFESALRLPADLLNRVTAYDTRTISQEFQLLSPVGEYLEYVAGLYYYDEKYNIDQHFDLGAAFCPAVRNLVTARVTQLRLLAGDDPLVAQAIGAGAGAGALAQCSGGAQNQAISTVFQQELTSLAAFGQLTLNINEQLRLTGGTRWTRDNKSGSFNQLVPNTILLPPSGTNPLGINLRTIDNAPDLGFKENKVTWMANVSYDVSSNIMAFATFSTGFKSGGFNSDGANTVIPRIFESETVNNYELGIKSFLFQNRMIANLTFFRTDIDNFQDRQFDGVNFIVQNVGKLSQNGFELDLQAQPNENFFMVAGLSYLGSEFKSFPNATNLPAIVAAAQAVGATPPPRDLAGERNHFSPKWQVSLMGEYRDRLGATGLGWFLRGEYQHTSSQNVGAETNQNPQSIQSAYDLVNARFGITGIDDRWEVAVFGRNLTDKGYCQTVFNQPIGTTLGLVDPATGGGMQRCVLGAPRTFGLEAGFNF